MSKWQWITIVVFVFVGLMGVVQLVDNIVILTNAEHMKEIMQKNGTTRDVEMIRISFIIPVTLGLAFFALFSTVGFWNERWQVRFWPVVPGLLLIYGISALVSVYMFPQTQGRQVLLGVTYLVLAALSGWLGLVVTRH